MWTGLLPPLGSLRKYTPWEHEHVLSYLLSPPPPSDVGATVLVCGIVVNRRRRGRWSFPLLSSPSSPPPSLPPPQAPLHHTLTCRAMRTQGAAGPTGRRRRMRGCSKLEWLMGASGNTLAGGGLLIRKSLCYARLNAAEWTQCENGHNALDLLDFGAP